MGERKITVVISECPSPLVAERLRMGVGLTLEDGNKVRILFTDGGIYAVSGIDRERGRFDLDRHLEMFNLMELPVYFHAPSAAARGIAIDRKGFAPVDDDGAAALLRESDVVLG
ncbi:MAG: hypothetical protein HQK87_00405 [Nitrospinae bacterium]|nr:hypothetical protein [Nitrospinota bacterium]